MLAIKSLPPYTQPAMPSSIPLLVAHPKKLIRAGLRVMLAGSSVKIVGEASDVPSTLTLAWKQKPAVVLLDSAISGCDAFEMVTKLAANTIARVQAKDLGAAYTCLYFLVFFGAGTFINFFVDA